jgi:hypothetical protein
MEFTDDVIKAWLFGMGMSLAIGVPLLVIGSAAVFLTCRKRSPEPQPTGISNEQTIDNA